MNYSNFNFSLGISPSVSDISQCLQLLDNSFFENIEIPGTWLESHDLESALERTSLNITGVTNIIEASVAASIADYNDTIKNGFIEKVYLLLNKLDDLRITCSSIDPGVATQFASDTKTAERAALLRRIAPKLYTKDAIMNIPLRIPSVADIPRGGYVNFLQKTMCGKIRLAVNIHPHERISRTPAEILEEFRFFIDTISFIYEPETGNLLVRKVIDPWLEAAEKLDFTGPVIFRPIVSGSDKLAEAAENLKKVIETP